MIEYTGKDAKEISEAMKKLILLCTDKKAWEMSCTLTFGDVALDCRFQFKPHTEEGEE